MTVERTVIEHYRHGALEDALLKGLAAAGKDINNLTPDDLAPADEFHIGGRQATIDFAAEFKPAAVVRESDFVRIVEIPALHRQVHAGEERPLKRGAVLQIGHWVAHDRMPPRPRQRWRHAPKHGGGALAQESQSFLYWFATCPIIE
jgi:hypothetical protein